MNNIMKLGVICDGISRDLSVALAIMDECGLAFAELQFVGDKEIGDHSREEITSIKSILEEHGKSVSCLSRHIFNGLTVANKPGDELHTQNMDSLKRVIDMAKELNSPLVRIMTPKKEQILWGKNGAEQWNVAKGAWDATLALIDPAVDLARSEDIILVVETGNGIMVNSNYTARRLIDELNAKNHLKVLWDPGNNCWCHELAYPDGYEIVRDGYIGHVHIKDLIVNTPHATLEIKPMGEGQLGDLFALISDALKRDGYDGVISLESVYQPNNGTFMDGFYECVGTFKSHFG
ncbi:MAG: sugar phosphate isomerase/epimerase [Rhodobacteraceae bacterium]|nr:sugar phosphate isomerase/epimerase [Paracoccaceae bacterium]MCY4250266.1 sugar phosphate isomerase/epimerase [Paracoccaceae bacterium]